MQGLGRVAAIGCRFCRRALGADRCQVGELVRGVGQPGVPGSGGNSEKRSHREGNIQVLPFDGHAQRQLGPRRRVAGGELEGVTDRLTLLTAQGAGGL